MEKAVRWENEERVNGVGLKAYKDFLEYAF